LIKLGTDITQISRIEQSVAKFGDKFKERFLLPEEIARVTSTASLAGLWAAKEAIAKALGCGIGAELSFHDITITKNSRGAPHFILSQNALKIHPIDIQNSSLSISHDGGFAIAVVAITMFSR